VHAIPQNPQSATCHLLKKDNIDVPTPWHWTAKVQPAKHSWPCQLLAAQGQHLGNPDDILHTYHITRLVAGC
jgi:hypothetical protein